MSITSTFGTLEVTEQ